MKSITLLIVIFFIGCESSQENPQTEKISTEIEAILIEKSKSEFDQNNELGNKTGESNIKEESQDRAPNWLKELHESKENFPSHVYAQTIIDYKNLNDTITWGIIEQNTGVCGKKILVTHLKNEEMNRVEIESHCDHDLSNPKYSWKEYNPITIDKFIVHEFIESVHDSFVNNNGMLKRELDFDELETQIDTISIKYKIAQNGQIRKE